jgi:malic enzyme
VAEFQAGLADRRIINDRQKVRRVGHDRTIGGAFTQEVVEAMSRINGRPVILALSNPTEKAECTPEQAYTWSNGKAIYATPINAS